MNPTYKAMRNLKRAFRLSQAARQASVPTWVRQQRMSGPVSILKLSSPKG